MKTQRKTIYASAPGMRIINVLSYDVLEDGTVKLDVVLECQEQKTVQIDEPDLFRLIDPSSIKFDEYILKYEPRSYYSKAFKENVMRAVNSDVREFYCPVIAPSAYGSFIRFSKNEKPAVGHNFEWWQKAAKNYKPEAGSRIGTKNEYVIFLAYLINLLITNGWEIEKAWSAVCNDSKELGNYLGRGVNLDNTGSHEVFGLYDLANVRRIILTDKESDYCWVAGGSYRTSSFCNPLANLDYYRIDTTPFQDAVGWVIYDA